jgi:hypothetical protein
MPRNDDAKEQIEKYARRRQNRYLQGYGVMILGVFVLLGPWGDLVNQRMVGIPLILFGGLLMDAPLVWELLDRLRWRGGGRDQ